MMFEIRGLGMAVYATHSIGEAVVRPASAATARRALEKCMLVGREEVSM